MFLVLIILTDNILTVLRGRFGEKFHQLESNLRNVPTYEEPNPGVGIEKNFFVCEEKTTFRQTELSILGILSHCTLTN